VGSKIKATYFNSFGNKPSVPVFKPIEIMSKMRETYHKNNNSYHGKQSTAKNHLSTSVLDQTVKFKDGKVVKRTKLDKHKKISDDCMIQCFNLTEKEKFRQMIASNIPFEMKQSKASSFPSNSFFFNKQTTVCFSSN